MSRLKLPESQYFGRIKRMQELAKKEGLDAVIIASDEAEPANVRYFTNYTPVFETTAILIPAESEPMLLIGPETVALIKPYSKLQNFRKLLEFRESSDPEYPDIKHDTFEQVFSEINGGKKPQRIGLIGTNVMTVQVYEGIVAAAKGAELVKSDDLLRKMRMLKSDEELAMMRRAAQIAQRGFERALEKIKPGMTEIEAAAECAYGVLMEGAEAPGFLIWCVSGNNTNQAIGKSSHKVIEKNELVQVTMGAMYEGYVASFGRPFCFGKPSDKAMTLLNLGLEANRMTHSLIRPGACASDIANAVHGFVRERGFGEYIVYGPGHGTGMMECEYPFIESISDYELQPRMTFAVDTFLGGADFGMRYEDAAAVTETGEEQLSRAQQEIILL